MCPVMTPSPRRDELRGCVLGVALSYPDAFGPGYLAELRASTGLRLFDCCVLDLVVHHLGSLATFDTALASAARELGVVVLP